MAEPLSPRVVELRPPLPAPAPLGERGDEELMDLAAGGHRGAFEALVRRHLPRVTRFCAKFLGSSRAGEDVAQEVLVEIWVRRHDYRDRGRFGVFLFTVARSRCLNALRADGRRLRWLLPASASAPLHQDLPGIASSDQLDSILEEERRRQVREGLLRLPSRLREAVLLRFDQGLEYAEISRIVGRPETTVRSRVFHALKRLRKDFDREDEP